MFIDTVAFELEIGLYKTLIEAELVSVLPSSREARIQLAKLERMNKAFRKKFPDALFFRMPKNKLGKMRASDAHRLNQQVTIVKRVLMKLIEDAAIADMQYHGLKAPRGKVRTASQKFVHAITSGINQANQKTLREAQTNLRALCQPQSKP